MPEIKIKHVVTFSSEDKAFPAENLVNTSGFKKWKTGKSGEKSAMVVLQLEVASQIQQIDIGNESSAFVEVLVGRTGMAYEDYQVILVASSFMNPMESRGNQNINRVRIFGKDSLSQAARDEKWDMVKVVCSQPFNKSVPYGISFVKFYSKPEDGGETSNNTATSSKPQTKLGAFALKTDDSEDDISAGSLFKQKKEHKDPVPLTGAAAVRAAARLADNCKPSTSTDTNSHTPRAHKDRSHDSPGTSKTLTNKRRHSSGDGDTHRSRDQAKVKVTPDTKPSLHKQSTSLSSVSSTSSHKVKDGVPPLKKNKTEPPKKSKEKEFRSLMEKVTFVMSGFVNPERGDLRDKALAMGATYKSDWGNGCTHLICAFGNTPKYNQVKGKGRIVEKKWLTDCYKKEKLLPWRMYRLGRAKSPPDASDESSEDDSSPLKRKSPQKASPKAETPKNKVTPKKPATPHRQTDSGDSTEALTDMDTDEEIERVKQKQKKKSLDESKTKSPKKAKESPTAKKAEQPQKSLAQTKPESKGDSDEVYDMSTDEEEVKQGSHGKAASDFVDDLMDMFTEKVFFLYGKFAENDRRLLTRYIMAYDGEVEDYMTDGVHYVITDSSWDSNFDSALADNPRLAFVKSAWIYDCHEKQKLIPHQKYVVVPK